MVLHVIRQQLHAQDQRVSPVSPLLIPNVSHIIPFL